MDNIHQDSGNNPSVLVIILNFNGASDTLECIDSLKKLRYSNYDILIVDNHSDEGDKKLLTSQLSKNIKIILLNENIGFSGGNNIGIKQALRAHYDFVLLLNNDTIVEENFLEPLIKIFNSEEKLGIAAPQVNYYDPKELVWSAGGYISKVRGSGIDRIDIHQNVKNKDYRLVGFVSGCCMLIKKELLEKIGMFDENFFLYLEDTDLCFRTEQAGYKIAVSNKSRIYHKVGHSTNNKKLFKLPLYYVTRNRLYFSKKLLGKWHYVVKWYLHLTMNLKYLSWFIKGRAQNIRVVKKAFEDFNNNKFGKADSL